MEVTTKIFTMNSKGELQNAYSPLQNLVSDEKQLGDFRSDKLKFDKFTPVDIIVTDEYDGSENLIINDDHNFPKLINTRFSVQENKTFNIPIHSGNNVLNIYDNQTFDIDTQLLKLYNKIPTLTFNGIGHGGSMKCGSYIFYFKLADSDNNLTNIVQESGIVQIHMGVPNTAKIRMGQEDENAEKTVSFTLSDLDEGFDYVRVFYERVSTDESQAIVNQFYMIDQNFPIRNKKCEILLTGAEPSVQITKSDIQNEYADIQTAKTQAVVDNTLFLGNVSAYEQDYHALQEIAWRIIPSIVTDKNIGSINTDDYSFTNGVFYNMKNVYQNVGYWPDELYRFGIVFIYENNILSPVFNIQGCDLSKYPTESANPNENYTEWVKNFFEPKPSYYKRDSEPDDFFFNKTNLMNSKGVIKFPVVDSFKETSSGLVTPNILGIKFDFQYIIRKNCNSTDPATLEASSVSDLLKKHHIKGFFFVRQKRIPTIIAQGVVVGLTGRYNGCIPVIQNNTQEYVTKSFLGPGRTLQSQGATVKVESDVETKALFVPDYEIDTPTLNQIFTGQKFQLTSVYNIGFRQGSNIHHYYTKKINDIPDKLVKGNIKLTGVQKETKIITDGENYFSTLAGNPHEPYKTEDVNYIWNKTRPQILTTSTSLIRGNWGSYVGISSGDFNYGDVVNIKLNDWENEETLELEFQKRFSDYSFYSAITDRKDIRKVFKSPATDTYNITCYRGDCFQSVFTHRVMSNFIDPELPTNDKIVDPSCWAKNYAVRCTAEILGTAHSNLTSDSDGWYIPSPVNKKSAIVSLIFGILTGNIGTIIRSATELSQAEQENSDQLQFANEIAQAFEVYVGDDNTLGKGANPEVDEDQIDENSTIQEIISKGHIKKVNPKEQEQSGGFNLKAIFKSDDKWELHGLASINRADVNAVSFGQWITFPICSRYNLALRDIEFKNATEEASLRQKRSFYPLEEINPQNHMLESEAMNGAAKVSLSSNSHPAYTTVPYIKQEYFNRIYWSKPNVAEQFINSYRIIFKDQYREYNKEFGAITKLVPLGNKLLVVFQHGLGILPVNRSAQSEQESSPYLSSKSVLPTQVDTLTKDYGSMWKDSVIVTPSGIVYGVDTVAKKIWRTNGENLEFISDHKFSKFLNEWINLSEYDFNEYQGHINVKAHYNEFKHDVMFTYYKDIPLDSEGKEVDLSGNLVLEDTEDPRSKIASWRTGKTWNLCYNEVLQQWTTFYDWYPIESCNIDNIFFSFDKEQIDNTLNLTDKIDNFIEPEGAVSYSTNKCFLDKAFTNSCKVYIMDDEVDFTSTANYLSFYCKGNVDIYGAMNYPIVISNSGMDSGWNFYVCRKSEELMHISTDKKVYISEIREWDELVDENEKLNLAYYRMRDSEGNKMLLWKHGQSGLYDNQGKIRPTHWYGKQHEFNVEFVVNQDAQIQKIFNNLKIISNKTAPNKFEYEIVGEGYDWYELKPVILWINKKSTNKQDFERLYQEVLTKSYNDLRNEYLDFPELFGYEGRTIKKIPFLHLETCDKHGRQDKSYHQDTDYWDTLIPDVNHSFNYSFNTSETILVEDDQLNEQRVHTEQLGNDVKKYGRLRGNMQYLEDLWDIEMRPIKFKWAYAEKDRYNRWELKFIPSKESRHRDKYLKVRVRYSGEDLTVIQGIITMFDYSMA